MMQEVVVSAIEAEEAAGMPVSVARSHAMKRSSTTPPPPSPGLRACAAKRQVAAGTQVFC